MSESKPTVHKPTSEVEIKIGVLTFTIIMMKFGLESMLSQLFKTV